MTASYYGLFGLAICVIGELYSMLYSVDSILGSFMCYLGNVDPLATLCVLSL